MRSVLVVEDEKMIRQGLCAMIRRCQVPVEMILDCRNGEMALEILKNETIDVVFTDIRMPKMDGIELVRQIQKLKHKPMVVAVSGYNDFTYAVEMMRNGVKEYLLKPVERDKLEEVLIKLEQELKEAENVQKEQASHYQSRVREWLLKETEEDGSIKDFFAKTFGEESYIALCYGSNVKALALPPETICVRQIGGQTLYLAGEEEAGRISQKLLSDYAGGISKSHRGCGQARIAWQEAMAARKEAFRKGSSVVYGERQEREEESEALDFSVEQIVSVLGTDRAQEAAGKLDKLLQKARFRKYPIDKAALFMKQLTERIRISYDRVLCAGQEGLQPESFGCPLAFNSIDEYRERFSEWLRELIAAIEKQGSDSGVEQKMKRAVKYVEENYDKDLNMAVVSNLLSMNYSQFSQAFKQYTGTNFVNYLKEKRLTEAKRMLTETDLKILDISQRVGYDNEKHFMKVFKSTCGISPTEYRKNSEWRS